jgi:hypothetical protein
MKKMMSLTFLVLLITSSLGATAIPDKKINQSYFNDSFDMVIISPELFSSELQSLIDHKNSVGIKTTMKIVEDIYEEYNGRDQPEKIKYFIKEAIEQWNITYVLLVGSLDYIPIRKTYGRVWLYSGSVDMPTDHYYADIYTENGSFSSWDTNHNDKFGEFRWDNIWDYNWNNHTIDTIDLYPDVSIGRLLCNSKNEVANVVKKIITYETGTYGKEWFKNLLLMGGDTSTYAGSQIYEGELVNDLVAEKLQVFDFKPIRLWTSLDNFKPFSINWKLSQGAGFVCYSGHGVERGIATYPPHGNKTIYYDVLYLLGVFNGYKLPIVYLDACLTANPEYYTKVFGMQVPCFAWALTKKAGGGAIATIGSTRLGYTSRSSGIPQYGSSLFCIKFFDSYDGELSLGQMFKQAQEEYLKDVGGDYYTLEVNILLGDPSLKIGGYPQD